MIYNLSWKRHDIHLLFLLTTLNMRKKFFRRKKKKGEREYLWRRINLLMLRTSFLFSRIIKEQIKKKFCFSLSLSHLDLFSFSFCMFLYIETNKNIRLKKKKFFFFYSLLLNRRINFESLLSNLFIYGFFHAYLISKW